MYGVYPYQEYTYAVNGDATDLSFEDYVNKMGPVWEYMSDHGIYKNPHIGSDIYYKLVRTTYEGWSTVGGFGELLMELAIDVSSVAAFAAAIAGTGAITGIAGIAVTASIAPELLISIAKTGVDIVNIMTAIIYTATSGGFSILSYESGYDPIDLFFSPIFLVEPLE